MKSTYETRPEEEVFSIIHQSISADFKANNRNRLALFGAGKFTQRFLPIVKSLNLDIDIIAVIDDNAQEEQSIEDTPILKPENVSHKDFDAILLCTDSIEEIFQKRVQDLYGKALPIYRFSELMQENKISREVKVLHSDKRSIWQRAYDDWNAGNQCADFKDCVVLAAVWGSSSHYNERIYEYDFVKNNFNFPKGKVLDIGSSALDLPRTLNARGFDVTCIDPCIQDRVNDGIKEVRGDIRSTKWPADSFDYITCISTIEHIGVSGRYRITENDDLGDLDAVREMLRLLKPGGQLFLTVPFGQVAILPINRTYTESKILEMTKGLNVLRSAFYRPDGQGDALECTATEASNNDWRRDGYYALGCYQFEKPIESNI